MLDKLNEMFIDKLKLSPDIWMFVAIAIVGVVFVVTLVIGLLLGDFKNIKSLMASVAAKPANAVGYMKKMPAGIKAQYKNARISGAKPSQFLTERDCVTAPYRRSLISKVWLATFIATVIAAAIAYAVCPIAVMGESARALAEGEEYNEVLLSTAGGLSLFVVSAAGGLLTLAGAIIGKLALGRGLSTYAKFIAAIDGDKVAAPEPKAEEPKAEEPASGFVFDQTSEPAATDEGFAEAQEAPEAAPQFGAYEEPAGAVYESVEPVVQPYAEPVMEPAPEPVVPEVDPAAEAARAREEAIAAARAEQERIQAEAARQAAEAAAQAEALRAAQEAEAARQAAAAAHQSSSADDVIARIEQIDREGAPRETMREVATLLQKERAKPENKTPEQQKKLNEALSKLLKAMSAASKK